MLPDDAGGTPTLPDDAGGTPTLQRLKVAKVAAIAASPAKTPESANDDGRPARACSGTKASVVQSPCEPRSSRRAKAENPQPILLDRFVPNGLLKFLVHRDEG